MPGKKMTAFIPSKETTVIETEQPTAKRVTRSQTGSLPVEKPQETSAHTTRYTVQNVPTKVIYKEIYKKPHPKARKLFNHWRIETVNDTHQVDLLFLPEDQGYKYALTLIDVASRYKQARPIKDKNTLTIKTAIQDIYTSDRHLKYPKTLNSDSGSEFRGVLTEWCKKLGIEQRFNQPSYHLAFVESFNKELSKLIFARQTMKEIDSGKANKVWVKFLEDDIKFLNNRYTRLIDLKPIEAVKMTVVPQPDNKLSKADSSLHWENGTIVRRLLNDDEVQNLTDLKIRVERKRETDPNWSFQLYEVISSESHCVNCLYYHQIKDLFTGKVFPHGQTYWELQESQIRVK